MDKLSLTELRAIVRRRFDPPNIASLSRIEMEKMLRGFYPLDFLEEHIGCFTMVNFNIDKCLQNIVVPDNWRWIGLETRLYSWVNLLINEDPQKQALICELPTIYSEPYEMRINIEPINTGGKVSYVMNIQEIPNKIIGAINNCRKRFIIIPFHIHLYDLFGQLKSIHSNVLLLDVIARTVSRFEPHGQFTYQFSDLPPIPDEMINNTLEQIFQKQLPSYIFVAPLEYCPRLGPQYSEIEAQKHGYTRNGFCTAFSLLFIHLRLSHPNLPRSSIIDIMTDGGPIKTYERILKFAYLVSQVDTTVSIKTSELDKRLKFEEIAKQLMVDDVAQKIITVIDPVIKKLGINAVYPKSFMISLPDETTVKDIQGFDKGNLTIYRDDLMHVFFVVSMEKDIDEEITIIDIKVEFPVEDGIDNGLMYYIAGHYNSRVDEHFYSYYE